MANRKKVYVIQLEGGITNYLSCVGTHGKKFLMMEKEAYQFTKRRKIRGRGCVHV